VAISEYPAWLEREPLERFLNYPARHLSVRATAGFLSRIEKSSLRFVPGFKERVRSHLAHVSSLDRFVGVSV
jgi:DNA (cytosine-5)-methyltransferase 1